MQQYFTKEQYFTSVFKVKIKKDRYPTLFSKIHLFNKSFYRVILTV